MDNIALEFKDVTGKGFGFKLKNVSMTLENGYIYAVTGKNGAGKTTLFNYILTEKKRYTGSIKLSGYELAGNHAKAMEITGLVSEDNVFFENRTGKQNADILGLVYDDFDVELFNECMKKMNVSTATTLWRMSRGERMIIYNRLWDTMKKKGISTYRLRESYGFNTKTIAKLRNNGTVTTQTLNKLCWILNCELSDIAEYVKD